MNNWWLGYPRAETTVSCDGHTHRIIWRDGKLHAPSHDDVEGERTLGVLGGKQIACIDLIDRWIRHADDVRVLALASRGPADMLAVEDPAKAAGPLQAWAAFGPAPRRRKGGPDPEEELISLLSLGGGLADRLAVTVAAAWSERIERRDPGVAQARAQLHAASTVARS